MMSAWTWAAAWVTASASKGLTRMDAAALVWADALLAMVAKGSLAVTLGVGGRLWIATCHPGTSATGPSGR